VSAWLRALGALILVVGLATAAVAGWHLTRDTTYVEAAAAYDRHPGHPLFQADYYVAAARHYGLIIVIAAGLLVGLGGGSALLGLGEILRRLARR
jgi:hypothetical protein